MTRCTFISALGVLALVVHASPAAAGAISFSGTAGSRSASVTFQDSGTDLIVTLTNVSLADVLVPSDVLTAVFFNVAGDPLLTRSSAVVPGTSTVQFGGTDAGGGVGGEWAYRNGLAQYGANAGISSSGLDDLFGPPHRFAGSNLQGPQSPDGLQYGLSSIGDDPLTGNAKVTGQEALIQNQVVFTLGNWLLGDPTPHISNVTFQYGTSLDDVFVPAIPGSIPEPAALLLFAPAMGLAARRAARLRKFGRRGEKTT